MSLLAIGGRVSAVVVGALLVAGSRPVHGQSMESAGARALGMAGAFVGLADDPSAIYWNPAGLAAGDFFGLAVDLDWRAWPRDGDERQAPSVGKTGLAFVGLATPPLGVGYYRLVESGRFDLDAGGRAPAQGEAVARLETHHLGVTLVHTLVDGLAVGATLKYLHGAAGTGWAPPNATAETISDAASSVTTRGSSTFDIDLGIHFVSGSLSVGLVARNLTTPTFASPSGERLGLDRQVRLGLAVRPTDEWVVAVDADLVEATSLSGPHRTAAAGVEHWWPDRRFGLRGGLRAGTAGDLNPVATFGGSLELRSGLWFDGHFGQGTAGADRTWGLALRAAF